MIAMIAISRRDTAAVLGDVAVAECQRGKLILATAPRWMSPLLSRI
jgi:hypothetical protein